MRALLLTIQLFLCAAIQAQQGFAFTRISTADGSGLASNMVNSLCQDDKGFIWVGTANGLQRFDGSKFIQFSSGKRGGDGLPHANISQIIPTDSGRLVLAMRNIGELGLFDPSDFSYKKITVKTLRPVDPKADTRLWKAADGNIYLVILRYGMLEYKPTANAFVETNPFPFPAGWDVYLTAVHEDTLKQQVWFGCDSGLCIYDRKSKQTWWRGYNPKKLALLENKLLQEYVTQVYIDSERRIWVFGWPEWNLYKQYKLCFDSTGNMLRQDTLGLNTGTSGFTAYDHFYETRENELWIYGNGVLFNYDKNSKRFTQNKSGEGTESVNIAYNEVYQLMQDKDGSLWIATDKGIYYTPNASGNMAVVNLILNHEKSQVTLTDVVEATDGQLWFGTRGSGILAIDTFYHKVPTAVYDTRPPANWTAVQQEDSKFIWSMFLEKDSSRMWLGCNYGVLLVHDLKTKKTQYLFPPEFNTSSIYYISQDRKGNIWFGTSNGRLVKYAGNKFTVVRDFETSIFKVFVDRAGWLWISTSGKGLFAVDPTTGNVLQHYTTIDANSGLYSNTGRDIEQLNDSIIVFGAGALNFINKRTHKVTWLRYEDGLPSNNVECLRMDRSGFLWVITLNGLCRYNPGNNRITPFGPKDGFVLSEQTNTSDLESSNGNVIFAGGNSVVLFQPWVFSNTSRPPNVTVTDFKVFNDYLPVDSLLQYPEIKLKPDQNSFSIYFASLSYMMRDKLTYYYKMEGVDKDWIKADRSYFVNYSLLPPGKYNFKIYCENIEGLASPKITQLNVYIRPPFWRTLWFMSSVLFAIALLIYVVHDLRIKRILAVEQLRHRVARDLHDDMGSTLSTINILSSMAKAKMNTDKVRTSEYLSKISDNSQRMMEAMDDIIWSIKPSNDSMQRIAARMREFATSVLEAKDIDLEFNIKEDIYEVKLNMEARRDFFLVFKEAINNAAKYSSAAKVTVNVTMDNHRLLLVVKDDGKGFDIDEENDGNGLGNMLKRTDHMNGKLLIQSKPGKGTKVTVTLPVYK